MTIDSHAHLADNKFQSDLDAVLHRAAAAGITRIVTIADSLTEAERCVELAETYDEMFCAVGVHPHNAKDWKSGDEERWKALARSSQKVRAIGEIGLDYHYDFSPREKQKKVFEEQLRIAKDASLPVVVHCREAIEDLRTIIEGVRPRMMVLHCCTEKFEDVKPLLERGYLLSFTGIITYPNAGDIRETVRQTPLSQMMIETDAPYLAPIPHRSKRNEPAFVVEVANKIAGIKGLSMEEVDAQTTRNAVDFFGLP